MDIRSGTHWAMVILGQGHIGPWLYRVRDTLGHGYIGSGTHWAMVILGQGHIGPW